MSADEVTVLELPGVEAAAFWKVAGPILRHHWRRNGGVPPIIAGTLARLEDHARRWAAAVQDLTHPLPSELPPPVAEPASEVGPCGWLSVRAAADRIGISERAVTQAAREGRIEAERRGRGRGVWLVSESAADEYRPRGRRSAA